MKKQLYQRSSDLLLEITKDDSLKDHLTYKSLLEKLGDRAFGLAMLFFSLPSALPFSAIPGVAFIFSGPIIIFSLQMIFNRKTLWLPSFIANRTLSYEHVCKIIHASVHYLIKIEYLLKPRWSFLSTRLMESINGMLMLCLALLLILPIPFSNFIFAILIIILSLGIIEKDGVFIFIGYIGTIFYIIFVYTFIFISIKAIF